MNNSYSLRRNHLLKILPNASTALLIEKPCDLYYLLGLDLSCGSLLLTSSGETLIVDGRYFEKCKNSTEAEVKLCTNEKRSEEIMAAWLSERSIKLLRCDGMTTSQQRFTTLQKALERVSIALEAVIDPLEKIRSIKDAEELNKLEEAAALCSRGCQFVEKLLRPGITEREVARQLKCFWLQEGADNTSFEPIIAFGENSAYPHHRSSTRALKEHDIALIDIGVELGHYQSDMTRVFFIGKVDPFLKHIYQVVAQAQQAALQACRAGVTAGHLDAIARNVIIDAGYGGLFNHNLGHGVGIEIHEAPWLRSTFPYSDVVLQKNMVLTIEPGIYQPGLGGVRLENCVIVGEEGCRDLTQFRLLDFANADIS